ncbi:hypothetical protein [Microbacterium sp. NPDC058389]|uniref:hypothetical protein n=1 Tax=Microbacterium sp. NPDC058389 TaxID=3346475 RepID=UPI0036651C6B
MTHSAPASASRSHLAATAAALAALLLAALLVLVASPARAHGGDIDAQLGQDGEGGVYVSFAYVEDGHPVEALVAATVEGRSSTGETVGPIALSSASQGVGIWQAEPGAFGEGQWELIVRVTDPVVFEKSFPTDVVLADVVVDEHADEAAGDAAPVAAETASGPDGLLLAGGVVVAVAVAAGVAAALLRARRVRASTPR